MDAKHIYEKVQERYGITAKNTSGEHERNLAKGFGYTEDELANIPQDANLGLSCGNPLAIAKLRKEETVIDLGSGAGFDVFLAAERVGANGKVIGIDMNKEMLEKANRNKEKAKAQNVSFVESSITDISLPDRIADCIISNCVVNLVPERDKPLAFCEMFRLLKPGGRVAMSDILVKKELPEAIRKDMAMYVGCVAGASQVGDYEKYLRDAGFGDILIVDNKHDLNVYFSPDADGTERTCCGDETEKSCCEKSPLCCNKEDLTAGNELDTSMSKFKHIDLNDFASSFQIYAFKK